MAPLVELADKTSHIDLDSLDVDFDTYWYNNRFERDADFYELLVELSACWPVPMVLRLLFIHTSTRPRLPL